tara:strand:+ start:1545 stop:2894 length:1350 start_codon:yes stop_codon:yes gene_type:complete
MNNRKNDLIKYQEKLLSLSWKYINKEANKINYKSYEPKYYLSSWANCLGNSKLSILDRNFLSYGKYLYYLILEKLIPIIIEYKIYFKPELIQNKNYSYICISWSKSSDFDSKGRYKDRYLNSYSDDTNKIIWIVINQDNFKPKVINENIILIQKKKVKSISKAIEKTKNIFFKKLNKKYYNHTKLKIDTVINTIELILKLNQIKKILIPYEAQPFQIGICSHIHKYYPNIKTIGYIHSALPPLPTEYYFRKGSPNLVLTHGRSQKNILEQKLKWPKNSLQNISSIRYDKKNERIKYNSIYLPYQIRKSDVVYKQIKLLFLQNESLFEIKRLEVHNHPLMIDSKKHLQLISLINKFLSNEEIKTLHHKNLNKNTIVIGASAIILELLELGCNVYHISTCPHYEIHSPLTWEGISVVKISKYLYKYKLKTDFNYIKYPNHNNNLIDILDSI